MSVPRAGSLKELGAGETAAALKPNTIRFYVPYFGCVVIMIASSQSPFHKVQHSRDLVWIFCCIHRVFNFIRVLLFGLPSVIVVEGMADSTVVIYDSRNTRITHYEISG